MEEVVGVRAALGVIDVLPGCAAHLDVLRG